MSVSNALNRSGWSKRARRACCLIVVCLCTVAGLTIVADPSGAPATANAAFSGRILFGHNGDLWSVSNTGLAQVTKGGRYWGQGDWNSEGSELVLVGWGSSTSDIFRLPEDVSFEEASFIEPLACVYRGQRLARLKPGQTVLVIGSGMSGLLHVQLAAALGAGLIVAVDVLEYKLEAAIRLGANLAVNAAEDIPGRLRKINDGRLADLVIICAGAASAVAQALACLERGGTVLFFAATKDPVRIETPVNDLFWKNEITLMSTYAGNRADHVTALELIEAGRVRVADMITHHFGLANIQEGFRLVSESKESIKVIIEPHR